MATKLMILLAAFLIADTAPAADRSVADIVGASRPSVVVVTQYGRDGRQSGVGAGFVVSRDGLIATCLHVIGEGRLIRVSFVDGRELEATEVFASDRKLDLAVIRVAATNLTPLKLADSDALAQGANVVAIGNPLGLEHSVVSGVVSARREILGNRMIQVAMPIEAGNSGGPLVDMRGRVHGLLTLKHAFSENLGFAMPINALKKLLEQPNPMPMQIWRRVASLDPAEWTALMGAHWRRKAGAIHVEGAGSGFGGRSLCLSEQVAPAIPYEIEARVKLNAESGAAGLAFGADGADRHYGFYPTAGQIRLTRFDGPNVFSWNILKDIKTPHYQPGEWNTLKVRVGTNSIVGFVNGHRVLDVVGEQVDGKAGLVKFRETTADFRGFTIAKDIGDPKIPMEVIVAAKAATNAEVLTRYPEAGRAQLVAEARALETKAADMRRLADSINADATRAKLATLLAQPEDKIELFEAALLVTQLDNPDIDTEPYRKQLREMKRAVIAKLEPNAGDVEKLNAVTKHLFLESGFHGSRSDFYNRANSYITDVLDDREGLPITLAVLFLELANAAGVRDTHGIALPTRFMVRHAPASGQERIIDVFDGGKVLTRSQAIELVIDDAESITVENFAPATKRAIVLRMLRNLEGIAERSNNPLDALRYLDTILAISPDSASDRLGRARARLQNGDRVGAREDAKWLMDREVPGMDAERLAEWYRSL